MTAGVICGVAFLCCVLFSVFRALGVGSESAVWISFAGIVLLAVLILPSLSDLFSAADVLRIQAGMDAEYFSVLLRGVGVVSVTQIASSCCVDCGQRALGEIVSYCGRIAVAVLSLPMIRSLAESFLKAEW